MAAGQIPSLYHIHITDFMVDLITHPLSGVVSLEGYMWGYVTMVIYMVWLYLYKPV